MHDNPKKDMTLSVVLIGIGCLVLVEAGRIPAPVFESFGARPIPTAAATALIGLGALLWLTAWRRFARSTAESREAAPRLSLVPAKGTILILLALMTEAAMISFLHVQYVPAAWSLAVAIGLIIGGMGIGNIARSVLVGGVLAFGTFALFTQVFFLDLP